MNLYICTFGQHLHAMQTKEAAWNCLAGAAQVSGTGSEPRRCSERSNGRSERNQKLHVILAMPCIAWLGNSGLGSLGWQKNQAAPNRLHQHITESVVFAISSPAYSILSLGPLPPSLPTRLMCYIICIVIQNYREAHRLNIIQQ